MRNSGLRSMEKKIAASDSGGISERVRYGWVILADPKRTHPNGRLKHGQLGVLIGIAAKAGVKLSDTEIQYRLQGARTYETEAKLSNAVGQFRTWHDLIAAKFPPAILAEEDEPDAPRPGDQPRPEPKPTPQPPLVTADGKPVPAFDPPVKFSGDEHGPRSTIEDLYAACKESEGYTERMAVNDAKRRAYVDELKDAAGGDLTKTWYEADLLRRGLDALGLSGIDSLDEIMGEFFSAYDSGAFQAGEDSEDSEDEDGDE